MKSVGVPRWTVLAALVLILYSARNGTLLLATSRLGLWVRSNVWNPGEK